MYEKYVLEDFGRSRVTDLKRSDFKRFYNSLYEKGMKPETISNEKIQKGDEIKYYDAAKFVTDRFEAYARMYLGTKSQHTISLMTMLDIAVKLMPYNTNKVKGHSSWGKTKNYFRKLWLLVGLTFVRSKRHLSTKIKR